MGSLIMPASLRSFCSIKPIFMTFSRYYAVKSAGSSSLMGLGKGKKAAGAGGGKSAGATTKIKLPVETDAHKLVNYVCGSNINITGEDVKIGPDSDYPPWLWELRTGRPLTLEEMDPNTKKYWQKVRALGMRRQNVIKKALKLF